MSKKGGQAQSWRGMVNRAQGKLFEDRIDAALAYCQRQGLAVVEKTPEPMRPIKRLSEGRFVAVFEKPAQPDYKGTLKGGRAVVFEAKHTTTGQMEQSRVTPDQAKRLDQHMEAGALCFVVAGFGQSDVFRVPWKVWRDMKAAFGRKYVTPRDLEEYRVEMGRLGALMLLEPGIIIESAAKCIEDLLKYKEAIERMGSFGTLFVEYEGDPRGPVGRAGGLTLEEEAVIMPVITDADGGKWRPVNSDVLKDLVNRVVTEKIRAEKAEREKDAAIKELNEVASTVDEVSDLIDNEVHPVCDYNLYLMLRENVDAIVTHWMPLPAPPDRRPPEGEKET